MYDLVKYLFENAVEAIFPYRCVCGKWDEVLCADCKAKILQPSSDICPICKRLSVFGRTCKGCRSRSGLTGVMVLGPHQGELKSAIWKLKYGPVKALSLPLGEIIATRYEEFFTHKKPVVTFVPSSESRMRQRGYNQAEEMAKVIALKHGLPLVNDLERPKDVLHQVGLTREERIYNAKGTVTASAAAMPVTKNRRIVIIDDVYTTGSTLEECAKALRGLGYREVWGIVLSRD